MGKIEIPCKIGDVAYGVKSYKGGIYHAQKGFISEIYFLEDMSLQIAIKQVCRGKFGETIFLNKEEAKEEARRRTRNKAITQTEVK